ncbi:MAG: carboxypeptidase regulatory-like domain-containing protein [Acidobacteria bacterium]|nr:carboxypeptidase regulatory-like domain-containing protein [Acidobacteriota bacterium]
MNSKPRFFGVLALAILVSTTPAAAQSLTTGSISGVVNDPSNALIRGAQVTLKDNSKGTTQATMTNSNGLYEFVLLAPGSYTVIVSADGFQVVKGSTNVVLGQDTMLNIEMPVGSADMTITVTGAAPLIQADNGNVAATINETRSRSCPTLATI